MTVLYEDKYIVICQKLPGYHSEISNSGKSLANEILFEYGYVAPVHRLDLNVGGAIIYAKTKSAAAKFSALVSDRGVSKEYLAVINGKTKEEIGRFEDLLFKDSRQNKSFVVKRERKGVKKAILEYRLLETVHCDDKLFSMMKINLHTGRSHQIRVQFASRRLPLLGDGKYGSYDNKCDVALWSYRLKFIHPYTTEEIIAESYPDKTSYPWNMFKYDNL